MQLARLIEPRAGRSLGAKLSQMVRARADRAPADQARNPRALSDARALWRQPRRRARRRARLVRQGAAPADGRPRRRCWSPCRNCPSAAGPTAIAGAAEPRATACSTAWSAPACSARARRTAPPATPCRTCAAPCRRSPPISPRRRLRAAPAGAPPSSSRSPRRPGAAWKRSPARRRARLGAAPVGRHGHGRCAHRRDPRRGRLGRLLRRRPRRLDRHDARRPLAGLDAQALHLRARLRAGPGRAGDADRGPAGRLRRLPADAISTWPIRATSASARRCSCRSTCRPCGFSTRSGRRG